MRNLEGRVSRLESAAPAPVAELTAAQRAELAGELRALLAAVPHEDDRAALLRQVATARLTRSSTKRNAPMLSIRTNRAA